MKKFYFLSAALLFSVVNCFSQPGNFDLSFGVSGKVNTNILDINKGGEVFNAVVIQPDGKIIAAGTTMSPGIIIRYNIDGSLDNSFDGDGMFFAYGYKFYAIALQPDGKIVTGGNGFVMRLNSNGSLDNSFDGDGITSGIAVNTMSIILQNDSKIVVASYTIVARFNANGSPDNSFDGDGQAAVSFGPGSSEIRGAAIQGDGKIVLSGYVYNGTNQFGVARRNADGSPDNSFDGDGMATTSFGTPDDYGSSVIIQADGKIVVAGYSNHDVALARYTSTGSLDNSFDGDGKVTTVTGSASNYPASMALQSDGKILTAVGGPNNFFVLRYNTNGTPDNNFDGDGIANTDVGPYQDYPTCMAVQSSGRIVVGGFSLMTSARDFSMACYQADGSLDNSFDGDGKLLSYFGTSYDEARGLAIQNDGKIIVGGWTGSTDMASNNDHVLTRYNPDGSLDNSFDGDGKLVMVSSNDERINAVAIQSDGKIVAAGYSDAGGHYSFFLTRYNTNGNIDNSFDGDGKLTTALSPSPSHNYINAIAIQSDGKIVAAGFCGTNSSYDFALTRYNTDGSLDNTFDGDGKIILSLSATSDIIYSLIIESDGKIVVAGSTGIGVNVDFAMARFNANGSLDNSFGVNGIVITDINSSIDYGNAMAIQSDGKIIVGGNTRDYNGTYNDFAVVRYTANGSLDNTFDGDGKFTAPLGYVNCLAVQPDGKIIIGGEDFTLLRLNTNGSFDNSFDGDGRISVNMGMGAQHLYGMKLLSNRIYLAGVGYTAGATDFVVAAVLNDALLASLPLQLLDFSGKRVNEDALLSWKTENELNMLEYIVERSVDGRNYTDLGTLSAANRTGTHYYNFTDRNITSLNAPVIYYRLRQKGIDGKYAHSRIIALPVDKNRNIVLFYPNPVINEANVAITVNRQERLRVRITDNKGRLVKQQQWDVSAGSTSLSIDVKNLAAGMYYLEIKGESMDYRKQFIK